MTVLENMHHLQVVFGAGDSSKQHACAGKNIGITMLLILLVRLAQVSDISALLSARLCLLEADLDRSSQHACIAH